MPASDQASTVDRVPDPFDTVEDRPPKDAENLVWFVLPLLVKRATHYRRPSDEELRALVVEVARVRFGDFPRNRSNLGGPRRWRSAFKKFGDWHVSAGVVETMKQALAPLRGKPGTAYFNWREPYEVALGRFKAKDRLVAELIGGGFRSGLKRRYTFAATMLAAALPGAPSQETVTHRCRCYRSFLRARVRVEALKDYYVAEAIAARAASQRKEESQRKKEEETRREEAATFKALLGAVLRDKSNRGNPKDH